MPNVAPKPIRWGRAIASSVILAVAIAAAYVPIPGATRTVVVVSGSELEEPLRQLEERFERDYPGIQLELKFQGSRELTDRYLDDQNDVAPTVLIPANGELLTELRDRWRDADPPFHDEPRPIAKTQLVAIAWPERGKILFPQGKFRWDQVVTAMQAGSWAKIGGQPGWGSFDFVMTDPTRSNSGQLTLALLAQHQLGGTPPNPGNLNNPAMQPLFALVKRSVYQPLRSTDILLQEFIARGPNDADVALVYESIALFRWQQSGANQKSYQVYYLEPTIETVSTAAIARRNVDRSTADAARQFLDWLTTPEQQAVFVQHGFRPVDGGTDLAAVPNSPWNQSVPGAQTQPPTQTTPMPEAPVLQEIIRLWERAN